MVEEIPLEEQIYDILFESDPLKYEDAGTKNMIYTNNSQDFREFLNSSKNVNELQDKIYQFYYTGSIEGAKFLNSEDLFGETFINENMEKMYHDDTIKLVGIKEDYQEIAEKIFALKTNSEE